MENLKDILLVPYDFSEVGDYALEHAVGLAKTIDHDVYIFHVLNKDSKAKLKKENLPDDFYEKKLQEVINKIAESNKVYIKYIIREGSIFTDIAALAKEVGARFIFMGTHGKKGLQHVTGSWALKVIISSDVPFIVVQKKKYKDGYRNIILPIDHSVESKQKVKWAIYIAKTFGSIVHIFTTNESDELAQEKVFRNTQQIKGFFEKNDISYIVKVNDEKGGNFGKAVVAYAEFVNAELIAIMTNPNKILPGFILGKWEEEVLFNTSKIPVMCINPRDFNILIYGR
ncbi:MAG: universal stress protein [Bacteroidales bacterium]|nr:universal stress protein [Bacteroidales bacterium]